MRPEPNQRDAGGVSDSGAATGVALDADAEADVAGVDSVASVVVSVVVTA